MQSPADVSHPLADIDVVIDHQIPQIVQIQRLFDIDERFFEFFDHIRNQGRIVSVGGAFISVYGALSQIERVVFGFIHIQCQDRCFVKLFCLYVQIQQHRIVQMRFFKQYDHFGIIFLIQVYFERFLGAARIGKRFVCLLIDRCGIDQRALVRVKTSQPFADRHAVAVRTDVFFEEFNRFIFSAEMSIFDQCDTFRRRFVKPERIRFFKSRYGPFVIGKLQARFGIQKMIGCLRLLVGQEKRLLGSLGEISRFQHRDHFETLEYFIFRRFGKSLCRHFGERFGVVRLFQHFERLIKVLFFGSLLVEFAEKARSAIILVPHLRVERIQRERIFERRVPGRYFGCRFAERNA